MNSMVYFLCFTGEDYTDFKMNDFQRSIQSCGQKMGKSNIHSMKSQLYPIGNYRLIHHYPTDYYKTKKKTSYGELELPTDGNWKEEKSTALYKSLIHLGAGYLSH